MELKKKFTYLGTTYGFSGDNAAFIYTVTSIHIIDKVIKRKLVENYNQSHRCWGWYPTLKEAKKAVRYNVADMHECSFNYAVIEKTPFGIPAISDVGAWWYKWIPDPSDEHNMQGKWQACERPEWAKGIIGWGIG